MEHAGIEERLDRLLKIMTGLEPGVIAFSGGVDSRLLACLADKWNLDFALITVTGPHLTPKEVAFARVWHGYLGLESKIVHKDPLTVPEVSANGKDRCYHCKRFLFTTLLEWGRSQSKPNLLEGSQLSDSQLYRPGRQALDELGVHSPLVAAGLRKRDVRHILATLNVPYPEQPSRPCLLTRYAYGLRPDAGELARLAAVEDGLAALGLKEYRLRVLSKERYCLQIDAREKLFFRHREQAVRSVFGRGGINTYEVLFSSGVSGWYDQAQS